MLAFALRASPRGPERVGIALDAIEPGVDFDAESLWRRAVPVTADDPLWTIVGMVDDDGPTDMSSNKHRCLADRYGDLHDK